MDLPNYKDFSEEELDEDDEWFFNSFKRYDEFYQYRLENSLTSCCFQQRDKIIIATKGNIYEVMQLELPEKLVSKYNANLCNSRDFKIMAAGYLKGEAFQINTEENFLIISENSCLNFYSLPNLDKHDLITFEKSLRIGDHKYLFYNDSETCLSGSSLMDLCCHSLRTFQLNNSLKEFVPSDNNDSLSYLSGSETEFFIGLKNSRKFFILDKRISKNVQELDLSIQEQLGNWVYDTTLDCTKLVSGNTDGKLTVFDRKNFSEPLHDIVLNKEIHLVKFSPCGEMISFSGNSNVIEIFKGGSVIFEHNGHCRANPQHIWHPDVKNTLLSSDRDGELQAWTFKLN